MAARKVSADRVRAFSDGVFAVLITILVLELKPPNANSFSALLPLWPTGLSYVVSYLFIAIFVFAASALVALRWPVIAMVLICLCLVGYLRPDIPDPKKAEH